MSETYNWLLKITFPQNLEEKQTFSIMLILYITVQQDLELNKNKSSKMKPGENKHRLISNLCVYLHIFHGNDVYATLGSSLHQLRAERVHDDDGFENWGLTFFSVLQQGFRFALVVTNDCRELSCRKTTKQTIYQ